MRLLVSLTFIIVLFYTNISNAQKVADNASQWYNWTDDGIRHYVYELGKDMPKEKTAVVIHGGWGAEHSYLIEPLEPLSDQYRFILYDQRGSLRTPAADSTITLPRLVKDLEDLRKSLKLDKMTLMAHSAGNHLAYAYLAEHPERVQNLILMSPIFPVPFGNKAQKKLIDEVWPESNYSELIKAGSDFKKKAYQKAKKKAMEEGFLPDSLVDVPAQDLDIYNIGEDKQRTYAWRIFFTSLNSCDANNWRNMRGGYTFYDQTVAKAITGDASYNELSQKFWQALKSFDGSVHVLIGTCDFVDIGPAIWPNVVDDLKDGHIEIVQGAGHNAWIANPKRFQKSMKSILAQLFND